MRITVFCLLILTLLMSSAISYNDKTSTNAGPKKNGQPDPPFAWVACNAEDKDDVMTANAHIEVDIDYVLEARFPEVQYRANANVSGTGDPGKKGTWNCLS